MNHQWNFSTAQITSDTTLQVAVCFNCAEHLIGVSREDLQQKIKLYPPCFSKVAVNDTLLTLLEATL